MDEQMAQRVTPFADFVAELEDAEHEQFALLAATRVRNATAFDAQKQHLLAMYRGVTVASSFADAGGQVFDCIPVAQQPALKRLGTELAEPPPMPIAPIARQSSAAQQGLRVPNGKLNSFGSALSCPTGCVPVRRVTLEELVRFETLEGYLRKHGHPRSRANHARPLLEAAVETPHEYAHAFQTVQNIGGHSVLNVWDPPIGANQIFSLAQHWYVAEGSTGVQTVEVGWQVYPQLYNHGKPVLFTYWTADGYGHTGSYSNTAGEFVQYGATHPVGMALESWSQLNGSQVELELHVLLYQGNWWIFVNGVAAGYYPTSYYQGGPLASCAAEIDYGGETLGVGSYPAMGSGEFAVRGQQLAAYQRDIYYIDANANAADASLTASQDWPSSYTIQLERSNSWGEYFYFGGPGNSGAASSAAPTAAAPVGGLTLTGPAGVRLEGVSVTDVVAIIRQLSRE